MTSKWRKIKKPIDYNSPAHKMYVHHEILMRTVRHLTISKNDFLDLSSLSTFICCYTENGADFYWHLLKDLFQSFPSDEVGRIIEIGDEKTQIPKYKSKWENIINYSHALSLTFSSVDFSGLGIKDGVSAIKDLILTSWRENIFPKFLKHLQKPIMKLIDAERNGENVDPNLIPAGNEKFIEICCGDEKKLEKFRSIFEEHYIEATAKFYELNGIKQFNIQSIVDYAKYADSKCIEEEKRALNYLSKDYFNPLIECMKKALIIPHLPIFLEESSCFIKSEEFENLEIIFRLLSRIEDEAIIPIVDELEKCIKSIGLEDMIVSAATITQDGEKYVEKLIYNYSKYQKLIHNTNPRFSTALDKAFEFIVNDTSIFKLELPGVKGVSEESRCPLLLANYCDMMLRKTSFSVKLTADQIEARLKDVILILKYVKNKDVFMMYHKSHLIRRLILDASIDRDKDEDMTLWLKEIGMPADFVNNFSKMFQDIKISENLNALFHSQIKKHERINVKILTNGVWQRKNEGSDVSWPQEIENFMPDFKNFYDEHHSGRLLKLNHQLSYGTITFANKIGHYDLEVTTSQMSVLMAYNDRPYDKISFEDLLLATQLGNVELRKTLWSLIANPKIKSCLLFHGPTVQNPKDFTSSTSFWINQNFSIVKNSKIQTRGKINLIEKLQLSSEKFEEEENKAIVQLRVLRTQEAILKVMKRKKKLKGVILQLKAIEILKHMFLPSKAMLNEQLEWLIKEKCLSFEKEKNVYKYLI